MIDLTPLDVRKKRGDFGKGLRGYDPGEVDTFLELVAERLEELVKENLTLKERSERLAEQVKSQQGREEAVQEALVTAQELRKEVREQARKEAELLRKEAENDAERIVAHAEAKVEERRKALEELERRRIRFLRAFRGLLERELDGVAVEEGRAPLEGSEVEFELGEGRAEEEASGEHGDEATEDVEAPASEVTQRDAKGRQEEAARPESLPPLEDRAAESEAPYQPSLMDEGEGDPGEPRG